jgi:hypothetical protein
MADYFRLRDVFAELAWQILPSGFGAGGKLFAVGFDYFAGSAVKPTVTIATKFFHVS